jgi:hypothetical protein
LFGERKPDPSSRSQFTVLMSFVNNPHSASELIMRILYTVEFRQKIFYFGIFRTVFETAARNDKLSGMMSAPIAQPDRAPAF